MHDNKQIIHLGMAESQEPMLAQGMIRIGKCNCERISKYGCRLMKRNAVFFPI